MQLYASNSDGRTVPASTADKGTDYQCLECRGVVRLRQGPQRQPHFFHLSAPAHCRQHGKSLAHIQAQRFLENLFGSDQCQLERRFSEIDRIADVLWVPQRIIFEVQCSPITAAEVQQRNRDYASLGYQVVWLLHERQYNRRHISAAEMSLRHRPHYFIDINADGKGGVYDQYDRVQNGLRMDKLPPLPVNLLNPKHTTSKNVSFWQRNPLYFSGDLIDLATHDPDHAYLTKALDLVERSTKHKPVNLWRKLWQSGIVHPYLCVMQSILEKVSR